jgi:hypothetical protein
MVGGHRAENRRTQISPLFAILLAPVALAAAGYGIQEVERGRRRLQLENACGAASLAALETLVAGRRAGRDPEALKAAARREALTVFRANAEHGSATVVFGCFDSEGTFVAAASEERVAAVKIVGRCRVGLFDGDAAGFLRSVGSFGTRPLLSEATARFRSRGALLLARSAPAGIAATQTGERS